MTSKSIRNLTDELNALIYNPQALRDVSLNAIKDNLDGVNYEVVDPSNPFVFLHDNIVAFTSAAVENNESSCRRRYLYLASNMTELYPHMSDDDHIDRFAQPSNAKWHLLIGKSEIIEKAVPRDVQGVRKLIIPQDTEFVINDTVFSIQYPIEIRYLPHGGLQVVYNTDNESPINRPSSNTLDWRIVNLNIKGTNVETLVIDIPTLQYRVNTYSDTIVVGSAFKRKYQFNDMFFTCRIWNGVNGVWKEIPKTYSETNIDPNIPMARVRISGNVLHVDIPDIYIRSKRCVGDFRIDIYETKGPMQSDLRQFKPDSFTYKLNDIGDVVSSGYYTPLNSFSFLQVLSTDVVTGGRKSLGFSELKTKLIDNAFTGRKIPVSDKQLSNTVSQFGFDLHKSIDFVTDRIYYASVDMPKSTDKDVSTPIGILNGIITTSMDELAKIPTVINNGKRITITPETLYREYYGLCNIETTTSISEMKKLDSSILTQKLNSTNYLFTPLHYVLDSYSNSLEIRTYYLSNPKITAKEFIATNETLLLDVNTDSYSFEKINEGYKLTVTTRSGSQYKSLSNEKLTAQISFTPRGYDNVIAYLDGTLAGINDDNERVWEFIIETTMDIDRNHDIIVNNFTVTSGSSAKTPMPLDVNLNIIYGVKSYTTPHFKPSSIDKVLRGGDGKVKGIMHEVLMLDLGAALDGLWSSVRPVISTINYARWDEDVPYRHLRDEIKYNGNVPAYSIVDDKVVFEYVARKGDVVLGADGKPKIKYHKGTVKTNDDNEPIVLNPRTVNWRLQLFLFDAKYAFSNTDTTRNYMKLVTSTLIKYATDNIDTIKKQMLDKSSIFIYPKSSIGGVKVMLADGTTTTVDSSCRFHIDYYLTDAARKNGDLLNTLARISRDVCISNLNKRTITVSSILDDIRAATKGDIVDVEMDSIGDSDEKLYTLLDQTQRLTLAKKVVVNPNGTIGIKDDIAIGNYRHDVK